MCTLRLKWCAQNVHNVHKDRGFRMVHEVHDVHNVHMEFWSWVFFAYIWAQGPGICVQIWESFKPLYARAYRVLNVHNVHTIFYRCKDLYAYAISRDFDAQFFVGHASACIKGLMYPVTNNDLKWFFSGLFLPKRNRSLGPRFNRWISYKLSNLSSFLLSRRCLQNRRRTVQFPGYFDVRPTPSKQPPEVLHTLNRDYPLSPPGDFQDFSHRTHRMSRQHSPHRPCSATGPPRVCTRNQPNRRIRWKIGLSSKCLNVGDMTPRRRSDRDIPPRQWSRSMTLGNPTLERHSSLAHSTFLLCSIIPREHWIGKHHYPPVPSRTHE